MKVFLEKINIELVNWDKQTVLPCVSEHHTVSEGLNRKVEEKWIHSFCLGLGTHFWMHLDSSTPASWILDSWTYAITHPIYPNLIPFTLYWIIQLTLLIQFSDDKYITSWLS